jgi:hypothetical protein
LFTSRSRFRASRCFPSTRPARRSFASYELVEVALLSACGLILYQQRQIVLVKFLQPLIPFDGLERSFPTVTWKIEADHPYVFLTPRAAHARGLCVALFRPVANFVMVG